MKYLLNSLRIPFEKKEGRWIGPLKSVWWVLNNVRGLEVPKGATLLIVPVCANKKENPPKNIGKVTNEICFATRFWPRFRPRPLAAGFGFEEEPLLRSALNLRNREDLGLTRIAKERWQIEFVSVRGRTKAGSLCGFFVCRLKKRK